MSKIELDKLRKDPRLEKCAEKAGCTPDEFLERLKNAGIRLSQNKTK